MRVADFASIALFSLSIAAFALGLLALGDRHDLNAVYWLIVGALSLRAGTNVLRPRGNR
jgi:hypothetical protein